MDYGPHSPAFRAGRHTVYQGDCLEVMRHIPAGTFDAVITSPPYNLDIGYESYNDKLPRDAYLIWMHDVAVALGRVLKPDGSLFLNVGSTGSDPWLAWDVAAQFRDVFVLQNQIKWVKSISIGDDTVGHFKPIKSWRFLNHLHEEVFHFTRSGNVPIDRVAAGVPYKDKSNITRRGHAQDRRCAGNVWFIPYKTVRSKEQKHDHPAGYPVGLPERCMRLLGVPEAAILDPFLGAGTTLVAAEIVGCTGTGIELSRVYSEIAAARLSREVGARAAG